MRSKERNAILTQTFMNEQAQLQNLTKFLLQNSKYNHEYQVNNLKGMVRSPNKHGDNFRIIILECLYTSSQPNLTLIAKSMRSLEPVFVELNKIEDLDQQKFYKILMKYFGVDKMDEETLFSALVTLPGMGHKITALTIRNLNLAVNEQLLKINNWEFDESKLKIAVDVVITSALNQILGIYNDDIKFVASKDFYLINDLLSIKGLNPKRPILFEDLWFWGFYNQTSDAKKVRSFNDFNPDKLYAEKHNFARDFKEIEKLSQEFRNIINHKYHGPQIED